MWAQRPSYVLLMAGNGGRKHQGNSRSGGAQDDHDVGTLQPSIARTQAVGGGTHRVCLEIIAFILMTFPEYWGHVLGNAIACTSFQRDGTQTAISTHGSNQQPPEQPSTKIGLSFPRGQFRSKSFILLVPGGGVEPPRGCPRRILSPLRLPVPPSRPGWSIDCCNASSASHTLRGLDAPVALVSHGDSSAFKCSPHLRVMMQIRPVAKSVAANAVRYPISGWPEKSCRQSPWRRSECSCGATQGWVSGTGSQ
jgi:hypothetical protein